MAAPSSVFSSQNAAPSRNGQSDGAQKGALAASVNQFKGNVEHTQTIVDLKGRSHNDSDRLKLTISYSSNTVNQATTWNRTSPTGILGLGWDMPLNAITLQGTGGPTDADASYAIADSNISSTLVRQTVLRELLHLDAGLISGVGDGATMPSGLLTAFLNNGLNVSGTAVLQRNSDTEWTLVDDACEQLFTLTLCDGILVVTNGGETYQAQNFSFDQIVFYPQYNRWVVTSDDGTQSSFGGGVVRASNGNAISTNNSIAWLVWFGNNGQAAWTGPASGLESDNSIQMLRPRAWYLASTTDRFGNKITYHYNGFGRNPTTGLIQYAEQQLTPGGLTFTKSMYLTGVTDSLGRKVTLTYEEKEFGSQPDQPREYFDPHSASPALLNGWWIPTGFQDLFDVLYLSQVKVVGASGNLMNILDFNYAPTTQGACANFDPNQQNNGDFAKRLLTEVTKSDADGTPMPGFKLVYDLQLNTEGGQPGALLSLTGTSGGTITYRYIQQEIGLAPAGQPSSNSNRTIDIPTDGSQQTNLFYGSDYTVMTLYNNNANPPWLAVKIMSWNGVWHVFDAGHIGSDDDEARGDIDPSSLECFPQQDFVLVTYTNGSGEIRYINAWNKIPAKPGQWAAAQLGSDSSPQLKVSAQNIQFAAGSTFFAITQQSADTGEAGGLLSRYSWDWMSNTWLSETFDLDLTPNWIEASNENLAVFNGSSKTLSLYYRNADQSWSDSAATVSMPSFTDTLYTGSTLDMVFGDGIIAITYLQDSYPGMQNVQLYIVDWNAAHQLAVTAFTDEKVLHDAYDQHCFSESPLATRATVVSDSFLALNSNALRRTPDGWKQTQLFESEYQTSDIFEFSFFAGQDVFGVMMAKQNSNNNNQRYLKVQSWLPSGEWSSTSSKDWYQDIPANASFTNPDWLFAGSDLYYRGSETDWSTIIQNNPTLDLKTLCSDTGYDLTNMGPLVDAAPNFAALNALDDNQTDQTFAVIFDSGPIALTTEVLDGYKIFDGGRLGQTSGGNDVFATIASDSSDIPESIQLHRYQDGNISGHVTHYSVASATMDDGMGDITEITYDMVASTAVCATDGNDVSYYQALMYPGTNTTEHTPFGWVETCYINTTNGVAQDDFYDLLEGQQISKTVYDANGQVVQSDQDSWVVVNAIAAGHLQPGVSIPLRGGWAYKTRSVHIADCVPRTVDMTYVDDADTGLSYSGHPTLKISSRILNDGSQEVIADQIIGAESLYPALWAQYCVGEIAQHTVSRLPGPQQTPLDWSNATLIGARVTTWSASPSALGSGVMSPVKSHIFDLIDGSDPAFPFDNIDAAAAQGWQLQDINSAYTLWGQESEDVDPMGVPSAVIHSGNGSTVIGYAQNTCYSGFRATFFEDYENLEPFTFVDNFDTNCCATGTRSLKLENGQSVQTVVTPDREVDYVFGLRYRTAPDSIATVTVEAGETASTWAATQGEWVFKTLPFTSQANTGTALTATASTDTVWVDGLYAYPIQSDASFQLQNPDSLTPTLQMDAGGRLTTTLLNARFEQTMTVDATGALTLITDKGYSRKVDVNGNFDPANPNAEIQIYCAAGGSVDTFRAGGDWANRWHTTGSWSANDGVLAGTAGSVLSATSPPWIAPRNSDQTSVASMEVSPTNINALQVTFDDLTLSWDGERLEASIDGDSVPLRAGATLCPAHWVFVRGKSATFFYADGILLYSGKRGSNTRQFRITATDDVQIKRLALGCDVRLGVTYKDGAGRDMQAQQLWGDDSILNCVIRDPINRPIARTKEIPGSYGQGASIPPMAYRPSAVNRADFAKNWDITGQMSGDVSDYYSGKDWQEFTPSDDGGYPYWGTRYEASARNQVVENGKPGAAYAMNESQSPTERATQKTTVSSTWSEENEDQPYHVTTVSSETGLCKTNKKDQLGRQLTTEYRSASSELVSKMVINHEFSNEGKPVMTQSKALPRNAGSDFAEPEDGFILEHTFDGKHRPITVSEPNSGISQMILDPCGRTRFTLLPNAENDAYVIFHTYDALGRQVNEGTLYGVWSAEQLASHAADPVWPMSLPDDQFRITGKAEFDGDGHDPLALGMKIRAVRTTADSGNEDIGVVVSDQYRFDACGNIAGVQRTVETSSQKSADIRYAFNTLGQVIRIDLPDDAATRSISYGYDDQGNTSSITLNDADTPLASYLYNPDNSPHQVLLHGDQERYQDFGYSTDQRITQSHVALQDRSVLLALAYAYDADGLMHSRTMEFFDGASVQDSFSYNAGRMLSKAQGTNAGNYGSYDPNGNMAGFEEGDARNHFTYRDGTDQISVITSSDGSPDRTVEWSTLGAMTSDGIRQLSYDKVTNLTTQVVTESTTTHFAYGAAGDRALKSSRDGSVIYFPGAGTTPLLRSTDAGWDVLITGPTGILAWSNPDEILFPITDMQNSTLLVLDAAHNLRERHVYGAFGSLNQAFEVIDSASCTMPYRFQGAEWDDETGLYNFKARLYDPSMGRFHTVDPALQFPSPYVFESNTPLTQLDPTGAMSTGGQQALTDVSYATTAISATTQAVVGASMVGVAVVGVVASIFTAGVSLAVAAEFEAEGAAIDTGVITAEETVQAGIKATIKRAAKATAKATRTVAKNVAKGMGIGALSLPSATIAGGSLSSGLYALKTPHSQFNGKDFGKSFGIGAAESFAGGVISSGLGGLTSGVLALLNVTGKAAFATETLVGIAGSVVMSDVTQLTTDAIQGKSGKDMFRNVLCSTASGLITGALAQKAVKETAGYMIKRQAAEILLRSETLGYETRNAVRAMSQSFASPPEQGSAIRFDNA